MKRAKRTKIIATLGPASSTYETIFNLAQAGANVFRLNFSHGDHGTHKVNIEHIRKAEENLSHPIGILADLQGPKLRVGTFADGKVTLTKGDRFTFVLKEVPGDKHQATLPHPEIFTAAQVGTDILINDGLIRLKVSHKSEGQLVCDVIVGGVISDKKGVNVPGVHLPLSALTEKDLRDLDFILSQGIEWIALSFVQHADDIIAIKNIVKDRAKIVAKLEKPLALKHLREIVHETDAVMVARGDLGVELALEDVPAAQKKIIRACRKAGKPVIVATQMLESMVHAPSPTRAEVSDVAGAIFDHSDAVMLSAESASGSYPIEAVTMMRKIIESAEKELQQDDHDHHSRHPHATIADAITAAAREITHHLNIPVIVTITESGATTLAAAKERPHAAIVAITKNKTTARQLCLCWGAYAILAEHDFGHGNIAEKCIQIVKSHHLVQKGDKIIVTSGIPFQEGSTHLLKVLEVN